MKIVDLGKHLRKLRHDRTGRALNAAMRVGEVWQGALDCDSNRISQIFYYETRLPSPLLGFFSRLEKEDSGDIATIFVHRPYPKSNKRRLAQHWKEFVIIKELMHCWSPRSSYVGTPEEVAELLSDLNTPSGPFGTPMAKSDYMALLAAAEVILSGELTKRELAQGKDFQQIGHEHGLHPDVAKYICRHDIIEARLSESL
jgi:hypothetical protein